MIADAASALGVPIFLTPDAVPTKRLERLLECGFSATTAPPPAKGWHLAFDGGRLVLRNAVAGTEFRPDRALVPRGSAAPAIARACGARRGLTVLDAMAGWGVDGVTLAASGCAVTMTESHPVVFAMLADFVERCAPGTRVELGDARRYLPEGFDVVYLDPMFEPRAKTALPKKPMQVLREIVGRSAPGLREILALGRRHARERVVVKRHVHARPVGVPDWRVPGRTVRFDVYRPLA